MKTYGNEWRKRLNDGEFILGGHIFLPNPAMAEAMVRFGYSYLWIDAEHGAYDKEQIFAHLTAINGAGAGAFVRVAAGEPALMKPILEMGPDGIIVPMVNNAEDAARIMGACLYPPKGNRGFGPRRSNLYGMVGDAEYLGSIDDALVKLVQIEHVDGVRNLEEIIAVKGVDGVIIGPYDLSGSMGLLGQLDHPEVSAQFDMIVSVCKKRGIPCGPSIGPANDAFIESWLDRKVDFLFCGDELAFVKAGVASTIAKVEQMRNARTPRP